MKDMKFIHPNKEGNIDLNFCHVFIKLHFPVILNVLPFLHDSEMLYVCSVFHLPHNILYALFICCCRMTRNTPASPVLRSHQQFSWEKIISGNPERQVKRPPTLNRKPTTGIPTKPEPLALLQRQSNRVKQKFAVSVPEVPEPTKPQQQTTDSSFFSNPTPAMLEVISRMRQKASTPANTGGKKMKTER